MILNPSPRHRYSPRLSGTQETEAETEETEEETEEVLLPSYGSMSRRLSVVWPPEILDDG
jgi:hypothetical protein